MEPNVKAPERGKGANASQEWVEEVEPHAGNHRTDNECWIKCRAIEDEYDEAKSNDRIDEREGGREEFAVRPFPYRVPVEVWDSVENGVGNKVSRNNRGRISECLKREGGDGDVTREHHGKQFSR